MDRNNMATGDVIDFQQLLAPIPGDSPSGVELMDDESATSVFMDLKWAIKSAREIELRVRRAEQMKRLTQEKKDQAGADSPPDEKIEPPDWQKVYDLATDALSTKSKDMWAAAWLLDALTRLHGFAGLRDGFRLIRELSERYFDSLHPRVKTFSQLASLANGPLTTPIAEIPITEGTSVGCFHSNDYAEAVDVEAKTDAKQRAEEIKRGKPSLSAIKAAASETSPEFFVTLITDLDEALDEHAKMSRLLTERCGKDEDGVPIAPGATLIRQSLEKCRGNVMAIAGEVITKALARPDQAAAGAATVESTTQAVAAQAANGSPASTGAVQSRAQAFQTLDQLAKFFRQTEPLSPVSYELEKIVRWGKMDFPDLMKELISKPEALNDLFRQTGISAGGSDAEKKGSS